MKIVVLAGGISTERDVSLSSGKGIYQALKEKGHQVILLDVFLGLPDIEKPLADLFETEIDWTASVCEVQEQKPVGTTCYRAVPTVRYGLFSASRYEWRRRTYPGAL